MRGIAVVLGMAALSLVGCERGPKTPSSPPDDAKGVFSERERQLIERLSPLGAPPVDETNAVVGDKRAARLGQALFFDERLSRNGEVSCASCHAPDHGFSVPDRLGEGLAKTRRHPPSLLNAAHHRFYNWDGRADSLWAQAMGPLEDPAEMGFTRTELAHLVAEDAELRAAYEVIFGKLPELGDTDRFPRQARPVPDDPDHPHHEAWSKMAPADRDAINRVATNLTKAIAAYQTLLVRNDAPFDTFVEGLREGNEEKKAALSESARRGLDLFLDKGGCVRCHTGPNFTDGAFHNLGLGERAWLGAEDEGRWDGVEDLKASTFSSAGAYSDSTDGKRAQWLEFLTRTAEDHGQFKTPTLRNVKLTSPYMHGGHFATLEEVVRFYSTLDERGQVGHREDMLVPVGLTDGEVEDLVAFLESLTGEALPDELTAPPPTQMPQTP